MILYGNLSRLEDAAGVAASVAALLRRAASMAPGIDRHATLFHAFIRAGELVQGIADAEFERRGADARSSMQDAGARLLRAIAAAVDRSWRSGFAGAPAGVPGLLLQHLGKAGRISTRAGEGYAHYALYPEPYLEAARRSGLGPETLVIGIRSIGTGLAALVAAALDARPAISLRPAGHPFQREIRAGGDILGIAALNPEQQFAVVDEGPGMSGSSFASVARWLAGLGVAPSQIHFFPSHDGEPGGAASAETRAFWQASRRHPALSRDFLDRMLRHWVENRLGPLEDALETYHPAAYTPRDERFERPKFFARTRRGSWLLKFAGLGDTGERKLRDAQALACAGFGPRIAGLCYGFLVQEYVAGTPLDRTPHDRSRFVETLASYLAFRAAGGLGPAGPGASAETLRHMAVENGSVLLGAQFAGGLERSLQGLQEAAGQARVVRTDNRLHGWEWLAANRGFLKIDAVDHCDGHDLVGCQDIAWDVAGSIVEHGLSRTETETIYNSIRACGGHVEPDLIAAMLPCYLAFQGGLWATAQGAAAGAVAQNYVRRLKEAGSATSGRASVAASACRK